MTAQLRLNSPLTSILSPSGSPKVGSPKVNYDEVAVQSFDQAPSRIKDYPMTFSESYVVKKPAARRRISIDPHLFPSGKDDGQGAQRLLHTYVEHVLHEESRPRPNPIVQKKYFTEKFLDSSFEEQLESVELRNIPLKSSMTIQRNKIQSNSTEQKKFFILFTERLRRSDPALVRARLSSMNVTDFVITQFCPALARNQYLQYLMLHNNAITDKGAEALCKALQFHPRFSTLWIGNNRITDVGVRHLAELCSW